MSADRRWSLAAFVAVALALALPQAASAHAIDGAVQLPVPLWLYLLGAAVAVAASFVVTVVATRRASGPDYATTAVSSTLSTVLRILLRVAGVAWWYGAIVVGFVVADISPLPAVLLWIGIWVALPIVAAADRQPVAVAQPVPHDLRGTRVAGPEARRATPRRGSPLPARARPLAGCRPARRRRLVRADPAGERRRDDRRRAA